MSSRRLRFSLLSLFSLSITAALHAQAGLTRPDPADHPWEIGGIFQGGKGVTDQRDDFKFLMAGIHAGKTLTGQHGPGPLRGSFEAAMELFPYWQSFTPRFQRVRCQPISGAQIFSCSQPYTVGGTFSGASFTPAIFRWNFAGGRRIQPWAQAAGGILWTNHKYPAYGNTDQSVAVNGPNSDASVWNFTPQGGVGLHYFLSPHRSLDLGANAVHISSASLGDRNPGVNASVMFNVGYTWWHR